MVFGEKLFFFTKKSESIFLPLLVFYQKCGVHFISENINKGGNL